MEKRKLLRGLGQLAACAEFDTAICKWADEEITRLEQQLALLKDERDRQLETEADMKRQLDAAWQDIAVLSWQLAEWNEKAKNWTASPEAGKMLDGYRTLAAKCAELEIERDKLRQQLAALNAHQIAYEAQAEQQLATAHDLLRQAGESI